MSKTMTLTTKEPTPQFGEIKSAADLGKLIRKFRKSQELTLEKISGLTNVGMRFLSELERGKETLKKSFL